MTVQFFQGRDYFVNTKGLINREDESEIFTTEQLAITLHQAASAIVDYSTINGYSL